MNKPLISIITPCFNSSNFIIETIHSVICQSYQNWEMIIVDDCSTDASVELIKAEVKADKRIKLFIQEQNGGAAKARAKAIKESNGEYIAFLDSDDLWLSNKLENQLKFMQINNYDFSFTKYEEINEAGDRTGIVIKGYEKVDYDLLLKSCPLGNSTVMYNAKKLGSFEIPDLKRSNDYALWLQIIKKTRFFYGLNEVLVLYRVRKKSISSNKFAKVKTHWHIFRNIEKISFIKSMKLLLGWMLIKITGSKRE
jgi:teichuronic acid biosynthesis glycosyltransferase TuaG